MPEWLGKTIGRVRIEKLLARGGTAEVYLGTHLTLERPVAVKLLHSFIEEEPLLIERFQREAKVVAGLRHSNIVQIFDFDSIDGHPYIVMEYLKGPTLAMYLRHLHQRKKRIPSDQVAHLLQELTAALDYAHARGVIHRDIKPSNILLHNKTDEIPLDKSLPNDVQVVVTDFGLVRVVDTASHTTSGILSGTPAYMSPEQARGDPIDYRTDIYSLGIVLYEMLAGRLPFQADSTLTVLHMHIHTTPPPIPGIPARVQAVVDRALRKDPDDRYQTSRELAIDYSRSISETAAAESMQQSSPVSSVPIEVPTATEPEPSPKPARSRAWIGAGLFSLVVVFLLGAWALGLFQGPVGLFSKATQMLSSVITNTTTNPLPSAIPSSIPPNQILVIASTPTLKSTSNPSPTRTSISPTPTLGIGSTMISDKDGMTLLYVPAGKFTMGSNDGNADEKPVHPVNLDAFWIDKTEVTNAMYAKCVKDGKCDPPNSIKSATRESYYGNAEFENYPIIFNDPLIYGDSWAKANAYCSWANRRLPTEAEWEKAARGIDGRTYPWGFNSPTDRLLNYNGTVGDTTEVGKYPDGKSPYGALDIAGNVWEWVADWYGETYYVGSPASNPQGPDSGRYHVLRGGSWFNNNQLARSAFRGGNYPAYRPNSIGFRCAMSATP